MTTAAPVAPERDIARDMVRRALPFTPIPLIISAVFWQVDGVISSAYALALVLANFVAAAALMTWGARISLAFLMGAVLGGYVLRLALIAAAVLLVSVELEEIMALGDRIVVMFEGRIVGEVAGEAADERTLGLLMANAAGQDGDGPPGDG